MPAATGPITVGDDQELLIFGHKLPVMAQIADSPRGFIFLFTISAVARRDGHIDRIGQPVEHIEIVARKAMVDQRLLRLVWPYLMKCAGRPF